MIAAIHIGLISAFLFWLRKQNPQPIFTIALLLKLVAGVALGSLYLFYYASGDTWTYHADAVKIVNGLSKPTQVLSFFWSSELPDGIVISGATQPRALFFLKWITIVYFFTGTNYWITSLYFSLISFWASWCCYKALRVVFPNYTTSIGLSLLFVPSIVLWSSGLVKESLAFAALLGLITRFINGFFSKTLRVIDGPILLLCLWVLWNLKYYWLAVWLAVAVPLLIQRFLLARFTIAINHPKMTWCTIFLLSISGVTFLHPNFYAEHFLRVVVESYQAFAVLSQGQVFIQYYELTPTWPSILQNTPWAFISALFRPFVWEASNWLQLVSSIENLILFILLVWMIIRNGRHINVQAWLMAVVAYIAVLGTFLALSTPNFGSLSRFRIGFMPFAWLLVLCGLRLDNHMPHWFNRLFKVT